MNQTALIIQSIVSLILVILILLQERGTALGSAFGGGGESYSTRRGIQKNIYWASIVLAVVFIALALYNLTV
ncbi:MAG: preprotein translocase subunit SecG [Candidatus Pacebacteria bacterium]|jgi:preprotein translocase subunit SecG|nr:preprotein translocase subunit SecG [Candidatus Paceibacterota bacterium]